MNTVIDHSSLAAILQNLSSESSASEVHGLLSGLLCTMRSEKAKVKWFSEVLQELQSDPSKIALQADDIRQLDGLFNHTLEQLNGALFEFQLLLPEESESLDMRTRSLASWCRGFSFGFGLGESGKKNRELPADTSELIEDIQEIARADATLADTAAYATSEKQLDIESSDAEEFDFEQTDQDLAELEEYVRVGVLVINEELQPVVGAVKTGSDSQSLH